MPTIAIPVEVVATIERESVVRCETAVDERTATDETQ